MSINGKTVLAVIPARGGSKRVPRKNLRLFRGRYLLAWAYDAARQSKYIDRVFVSTEDAEIQALCRTLLIPFLPRPVELAQDDSTSKDVLRSVLEMYVADWIVLLQPTSPLRTAEDIDACIERAQLGHGCKSTFHGKTNGAVYVATAEWLAKHDFSHLGVLKHEMPEARSLDINEESDFGGHWSDGDPLADCP
jgi:N-acylneuraminate cytidylyltransferase